MPRSTFSQILKKIREENGWSQEQLAERLQTSKQVISRYERGQRSPKISVVANYAEKLGMSVNDFLGEDVLPSNVTPISSLKSHKVPMIGSIAAGEPILAQEEYETFIDAPMKADFALTIKGDSMIPTYLDGDVVYIRQQPDIDFDGQVAAVLFDDSATVKHVYKQEDGLLLISDNPAWKPMFKPYSDYNNIRILGKICGFTRMYKD